MTVGDTLGEAASVTRSRLSRRERAEEVARLLDLVGLDERHAGRLPRELSGGQRQRVAIARALAVSPQVLIADEITSALDASVQSAILNLLRSIQARLGLTVLFISHNLAVIRYVSDAIAVMYLGQIVELAPTAQLVSAPQHPYTRAMLAAVPSVGGVLDPAAQNGGGTMDAEPPDPHDPPSGCRFHTRCRVGPLTHPERTVCRVIDPVADAATRLHQAACHFVPTDVNQ
jgi:peptide/nickel transport system ATP-binding protein